MSLRAYRGQVRGSHAKMHIVVRDTVRGNFDTLVDVPGGQMTFRELMEDEADEIQAGLAESLWGLEERGPLFMKASFGDSVTMDPELNVAQPTVIDTGLETLFVAERVKETSIEYVARTYRIHRHHVERAVEFEAAP